MNAGANGDPEEAGKGACEAEENEVVIEASTEGVVGEVWIYTNPSSNTQRPHDEEDDVEKSSYPQQQPNRHEENTMLLKGLETYPFQALFHLVSILLDRGWKEGHSLMRRLCIVVG